MLAVVREEGETIDHLMRRYNDKLRRLNFFEKVKGKSFYRRMPSKRQLRDSAIYKDRKRQKMEYLKRIGKLPTQAVEGRYTR
jgi:ribosomal protein S21